MTLCYYYYYYYYYYFFFLFFFYIIIIITVPLPRDLHWLRVSERVKFRLCVLVYQCLHGTAPSYFADDLQLTSTVGTRGSCSRLEQPPASC